jgi:hypothetical protein
MREGACLPLNCGNAVTLYSTSSRLVVWVRALSQRDLERERERDRRRLYRRGEGDRERERERDGDLVARRIVRECVRSRGDRETELERERAPANEREGDRLPEVLAALLFLLPGAGKRSSRMCTTSPSSSCRSSVRMALFIS